MVSSTELDITKVKELSIRFTNNACLLRIKLPLPMYDVWNTRFPHDLRYIERVNFLFIDGKD
ncbi:hypothetical protein YK48G_11950 [Lentilactobacillus fungorum]|uniref:Uncharacterized protein n=1 Tax=Lentilactobacillus fungorum TaxID=2201250 RepID=A0ABQ3VYY9_9LACO|nr:hypothetical protein YK48G_11950 [Lentilactobacillus fungorum]